MHMVWRPVYRETTSQWFRKQDRMDKIFWISMAFVMGFTDEEIGRYCGVHPDTVRKWRIDWGIYKYHNDHYVRRSIRPAA